MLGKVTDMGDILVVEQWIVKGRRINFRLRIGAPRDSTPTDRSAGVSDIIGPTRKAISMDLMADKKVTFTPEWTDEMGNAVDEAPSGFSVTYTVDDSNLLALTDNGDGTATVAAVGGLGTGTLHAEASAPGMASASADVAINVVAGLAEHFNLVAGDQEEVTPDA